MLGLLAGLCLPAAGAPPPDPSYSFALSALAQRYYRLCQADARVQEQVSRDLNERQLPVPPMRSALESLPLVNRRDAELVCLGAAAQRLDDLRSPPVAALPTDVVAATPPARAEAIRVAPRPVPSEPAPARPEARPAHKASVVSPARHRSARSQRRVAPRDAATPASAAPLTRPAPRVTVQLDAPTPSNR